MDPQPPQKELTERHALLRSMIVESSLELLAEEGLGLGVDAISYARVFDHVKAELGIKVTRGSVHRRIWDSHDEYRSDVLVAVAERSSPHHEGSRLGAAIISILAEVDALELDHDERIRAFCRVGGHELLHHYLASPRFRRFQALKAVARGGVDDTDTATMLQSMIGEKADGDLDERIEASAFMFRALGLRAKRELELTDHDAIGAYLALIQILVTGAHLDHHAGYTALSEPVETGMFVHGDVPWTAFGLGLLATMQLFFERDPAATTIDLGDPPPRQPENAEPELDPMAAPLANGVDPAQRRSKEELRELLVSAGERLLLQDGIALTPYSLTYASVFEYVKATRGVTLHRSAIHKHIWSSQSEFQADVLAEAARYDTGESLTSARQAMAAQVAIRNPDGTVNQRQMIHDSTLAIVQAQMYVSAVSSNFRRWQSIKASMLSRDAGEHVAGLRQAVSDRYDDLVADFVETYRSVFPLVGLQVNPDLKLDEATAHHLFAVLGAAFTSGADYNTSAGATLATKTVDLPRVDGSGRSDAWPIQAMASLALLELFFVPM